MSQNPTKTPLNKIDVLDRGYVALVSTDNDGQVLKKIQDSYFKTMINKELWKISHATLVIKCPLFFQLFLSKMDFKLMQIPLDDEPQMYVPDISDIKANTVEDKKEMSTHMEATLSALIVSSKAYQEDGCDKFTSHIISPVSMYNELLVHGTLETWINFLRRRNLPKQIKDYQSAINDILSAEWQDLEVYKRSNRNG